jgi:cytochrome P450
MAFFSIAYYVVAPLLLLLAVNCTYNLFFHHLRHVPGPRLAALTRCWLFILEIKGHAHEHIRELHKIYGAHVRVPWCTEHELITRAGPVVRIAPGELSINDHDAYGHLYGQGSKFYKAPYYYTVFEAHGPNLFSLQNKEAHLADKRLMSNAFSRANVLKHEEAIYEKVQSTMERIANLVRKRKPVPLVPAFRWLTLATICDFAFGKTIDIPHSDDFASSLFEAFDRAAVMVILVWLPVHDSL